jgi:hypothetical protein
MAFAQTETGRSPLTEGTSFMVAFPQVWAAATEKPLPNPVRIIVAARDTTRVTVRSVDTVGGSFVYKDLIVEAGSSSSVVVPAAFLATSSEVITPTGIEITADRPVTVTTSIAWLGNGERSIHLPTAAWDTSYRSMNFWQDAYGTPGQVKERPAQILIIAAHDRTQVTYIPSIDTEGGDDAPSTAKSQARTVTLDRGETFLIRGKIDGTKTRDGSYDLTGTKITSTKPVAVISGHTKGAIMRFPNVLPPVGAFAADAHFVRNNVHETMTPDVMAGTEFVTVPCRYTPTRRTGQASAEYGIDDDRGDVIRIIALEDNTLVERYLPNQGRWMTERTLQAGQTTYATATEAATVWRTSKPAHCYQFGKSWGFVVPPPVVGTEPDDRTQGHPTVEAGMPMLMSVPPTDRWIDQAVFDNESGMDNFLNVAYRAADSSSIVINGTAITEYPANTRSVIAGTDFGFVRLAMASDRYRIHTTKPGVRFAAWNYGSLDGLQQGRAYGHTLGMDMSRSCNDSLTIAIDGSCGEGSGTITLVGGECARFFDVTSTDAENAEVEIEQPDGPTDRTATFLLRSKLPWQPATAVIRARTASGRYLRSVVRLAADQAPSATERTIDFGELVGGSPKTETVVVINTTADTMRFTPVILHGHPNTDIVDAQRIVLPPGDTTTFLVTATAREEGYSFDTLVGRTDCGREDVITRLRSTYTKPIVNVDFDTTETGTDERTVYLRNRTSGAASMTGSTIAVEAGAADAFILELPKGTPLSTVSWPITIPVGDSLPLHVRLNTNGATGRFRQIHRFAVAGTDTITVILDAMVKDDPTSVHDVDPASGYRITVTPQPANGDATISINGVSDGSLRLSIVDLRGSVLGSETHSVQGTSATLRGSILNGLPPGTYLLRVDQNGRSAMVRVSVTR